MKRNLLILALCLLSESLFAQVRTRVSLQEGWQFTRDSIDPANQVGASWQTVSLPHSWNKEDVMDDEPGYYRGAAWYRRRLNVDPSSKGRGIYLHFEGANQVANVYVNGRLAGTHTGGYNAFRFAIHGYLRFDGGDELLVKVDNSHNPDIPPLSADFTFFGGIYRDVWLITASPVHFNMNDHASDGIFISTPTVSDATATLQIKGSIEYPRGSGGRLSLRSSLFDHRGKLVKQVQANLSTKSGGILPFTQEMTSIARPRLWSPADPYLYTLRSSIIDARTGNVLDEIDQPVGFRWFSFDAEKGFFLNGKPLKLVGASRHQDRPHMGNAVPDEMAMEDIRLLKEMGGNFLRVAHYPQDPSVLEACDRLGILASVEIPVVNEIIESDIFYSNCEQMQIEMIRQHYNHPSVIIWCYMNEVLLRPHFNNDKERQKIYFANVTSLARRLDSITRKEDPYRYTMIAHHGDFERYKATELTDIPMIVGWNLYSGWYGGDLGGFPAFLDRHRRQLPTKPVVVSEYGADADPRIRSLQPVRFDKSVEYTTRFHQFYFDEIMKRPFVAGAMIWNLADFNSETREETMPHINNKGLLTWDRQPKDPYYLYKALLVGQPFIKILASDWNRRADVADSAKLTTQQPVQVATNLDSVQLSVNGASLGWKRPVLGICEWSAPFSNGNNRIAVLGIRKGEEVRDQVDIEYRLQPGNLRDSILPFTQINVLAGANRFFFDKQQGITWQPSQPYRGGGWGHVGGVPFKLPNNNRLPYGTDKNIVGTDADPIYQAQLVGIRAYRFDVSPGEYELTLHFSELEGVAGKELPYNLSESSTASQAANRRFHVLINGTPYLENFDIAATYGVARAASIKMKVIVKNEEGISITFKPLQGEPVVNALQLKKVY